MQRGPAPGDQSEIGLALVPVIGHGRRRSRSRRLPRWLQLARLLELPNEFGVQNVGSWLPSGVLGPVAAPLHQVLCLATCGASMLSTASGCSSEMAAYLA